MLIHFHSVTSVTRIFKELVQLTYSSISWQHFYKKTPFSKVPLPFLSFLSFFCWFLFFPLAQGCFKSNKQIKLFPLFPYCPRRHFNLINCLCQQPTVSDLKAYTIKLNEGIYLNCLNCKQHPIPTNSHPRSQMEQYNSSK